MKRNKLSLVLLSLLIIGLFFTSFSSVNASANDLDFTFEDDVLFDYPPDSYNTTVFNIRNQTIITDNYDGTYSFIDEPEGASGTDIHFIDGLSETGTSCSIQVINSVDGSHNKILEVIDVEVADVIEGWNEFIPQTSGTIEYWLRVNYTQDNIYLRIKDDSNECIYFFISAGDFKYYDGSSHIIATATADIWYHIRIDFECGAGAYLGLSPDDFYVTINGHRYGAYNFLTVATDLNRFSLSTYNGDDNYKFYIDAVGYSWDAYAGVHFEVGAQDTFPTDITWDGNYFWVLGDINEEVYKYYANGTYTGIHFDTGVQDTYMTGITWDGNYFWTIGGLNDEVYKYYANGTYTGIHFDVGAQDNSPTGITWDGAYLWIIGNAYDDFYKYYVNGTYTGIHFDVGAQENDPDGIVWDGVYFWVIGDINIEVYKYYANGTYTGIHFDIEAQDNSPTGITWDGDYLWVIGNQYDEVYRYKTHIYNIGDNVIPIFNNTNNLIVNADEFAFDTNGESEEIRVLSDTELINDWEVSDSQNDVSVIKSCESFDKEIRFFSDTVHLRSLEKSLDLTTNGILNFTMVMTYLDMNNDGSSLYFGLFRTAIIEFSMVRLYYTAGNIYLQRMNADRGGYTNLLTLDDSCYLVREFTFLTSQEGIVEFRYKDNSSVDNAYYFPKIDDATNYYYMAMLGANMNDEVGTQEFHFDSLSISVNGTTQNYVVDYSIHTMDLNVSNWNSKEHNLVNLNVYGYSGFGAGNEDSFESIRGLFNYTSNKFINTYNLTFSFSNPYIAFITNQAIDIIEIKVRGVKLNQGGNGYSLGFTYNSIDIDKSYFYVDSSNRLQYSLTINDNETEYIQASFDIVDISSENRSINFRSNINGESKGYFSVDYYSGGSSLMEFPYYQTTTNVILPQTELITKFTILITDNDLYYNGFGTGFVSNIRLIYNPDVSIIITTLNLLGIIVPLIIMIAPPLALNKKFGSGIILPMFILMSLVCVLTNLIPVWLFFIIAFSSIGFLMLKKKVEVAF